MKIKNCPKDYVRTLPGTNQYRTRLEIIHRKPKAKFYLFMLTVCTIYAALSYFEALNIAHATPKFVADNIQTPIRRLFNVDLYDASSLISPLPQKVYADEKCDMNSKDHFICDGSNSISLTPTPTQEQLIDADIKSVFGSYYPKAMLLLKGDGKTGACHENGGLNPNAININWSKTPGVADSKDYGVFQINDKWQGVTNTTFLFDPSINIRMAWNIFKNHGYKFDAWTCGQYYGI